MIAETLGAFAGGYALLMGGMAVFQRDMIYHPARDRISPDQADLPEMTEITVQAADGIAITGWYAPAPDPAAMTVVLFHGNAGSLIHRARKGRALVDAGFGVFMAQFRGYGGNPGHPSEEGLYADARAILHWLEAQGVPESRIALYGESLGTGVAVQMALEYPSVGAVVLEAPYTTLPDLAPAFVMPGLAAMMMVEHYDNRSKIERVVSPLLIIHGGHDGIVPINMGRELLSLAQCRKEGAFFPQAGHNDVWDLGGGAHAIEFMRVL